MGTDKVDTRERILEAAGEVFAAKGFQRATVRDICRRARVNGASVNYHFRNKESLYRDVLRQSYTYAMAKYPPTHGIPARADIETRFYYFVRNFLLRLLDPGRPSWHGRLMAREMVEPTHAFDDMVEHVIAPNVKRLQALINELSPGTRSPRATRNCVYSVAAQCLFYYQSGHVIEALEPRRRPPEREIEALARHISDFSLAAICPKHSRNHSRRQKRKA